MTALFLVQHQEQHQKKDLEHYQPMRSGTSLKIWLQVSSRRCASSEAQMTSTSKHAVECCKDFWIFYSLY